MAKIKNFRNKKYIKLINEGLLIRAGELDFFFKKNEAGGGDIYSESKSNLLCDVFLMASVTARPALY